MIAHDRRYPEDRTIYNRGRGRNQNTPNGSPQSLRYHQSGATLDHIVQERTTHRQYTTNKTWTSTNNAPSKTPGKIRRKTAQQRRGLPMICYKCSPIYNIPGLYGKRLSSTKPPEKLPPGKIIQRHPETGTEALLQQIAQKENDTPEQIDKYIKKRHQQWKTESHHDNIRKHAPINQTQIKTLQKQHKQKTTPRENTLNETPTYAQIEESVIYADDANLFIKEETEQQTTQRLQNYNITTSRQLTIQWEKVKLLTRKRKQTTRQKLPRPFNQIQESHT